MFERLRLMLQRYEELTNLLADSNVIADQNKWREYAKEHASMEEAITLYKEYLANQKNLEDCKEIRRGKDLLPGKRWGNDQFHDVQPLESRRLPSLQSGKRGRGGGLHPAVLPLHHGGRP